MEITITNKAVETLIEKVGKDTKIALAIINDSDHSLRDKGACAKGSFFQIIPFIAELGEYEIRIDHPLLEIYTSTFEQCYFGRRLNMEFDEQLDSFLLENEIAVLDYNIKLKKYFFS